MKRTSNEVKWGGEELVATAEADVSASEALFRENLLLPLVTIGEVEEFLDEKVKIK